MKAIFAMCLSLCLLCQAESLLASSLKQEPHSSASRKAEENEAGEVSLLSVSEAATRFETRNGGRVLSARESIREGRLVYEIKWMRSPGRVEVIFLDPQSGLPLRAGKGGL
jgi:uncharacterized membrane protein YkoI